MKIVNQEQYDVVILGSGEGSKYLAWTLAKEGQHVAVVERKYIGGSCPNIACLPSKNVIQSAKVASYFRRSEEFGIKKNGFTVDMHAVRLRKRKMVADLIEMHLDNFNKSGAELIMGQGRFVGPKTLEATLEDGSIRPRIRTRTCIRGLTFSAISPNFAIPLHRPPSRRTRLPPA